MEKIKMTKQERLNGQEHRNNANAKEDRYNDWTGRAAILEQKRQ